MRWRGLVVGICLGVGWASDGRADDAALARNVGMAGCHVLAARVDSISGGGPVLLRSFDSEDGAGASTNPALAGAAFTYDNALAVIALTACGRIVQARRIGDALALAALHDRAGADGRLRNAYRAGLQAAPPPPNGWWDERERRWLEDAYQVGTATGNVAWAGLALLTLHHVSDEPRYRDAAAALGRWIASHVADRRGSGGYIGGIFGDGLPPRQQSWKATEHHVDLVALFSWLARVEPRGTWDNDAAQARTFLVSQWDPESGHFLTGTLDDGITPNRSTSGLDAQLWPLLLPAADPEWSRALSYAERAHGVAGGFSFNDDRRGVWVEGTAQAALAYTAVGRSSRATAIVASLSDLFSPGGLIWATRDGNVSTGLAIGPDSRTADFLYYHQPHVGATAWAVLAALRWNPFTGQALPKGVE